MKIWLVQCMLNTDVLIGKNLETDTIIEDHAFDSKAKAEAYQDFLDKQNTHWDSWIMKELEVK